MPYTLETRSAVRSPTANSMDCGCGQDADSLAFEYSPGDGGLLGVQVILDALRLPDDTEVLISASL